MADVTRWEIVTFSWRCNPSDDVMEQDDDGVWVKYADHLATLERVRVETRAEERAGLIRDARQQRAYYAERFRSQPSWDDLMAMLEDDWLARQRAGEFDDEVAVKVQAARVEVLREVKTAVMHLPVVGRLVGTDSTLAAVHVLDAIDRLIDAATRGDSDD